MVLEVQVFLVHVPGEFDFALLAQTQMQSSSSEARQECDLSRKRFRARLGQYLKLVFYKAFNLDLKAWLDANVKVGRKPLLSEKRAAILANEIEVDTRHDQPTIDVGS